MTLNLKINKVDYNTELDLLSVFLKDREARNNSGNLALKNETFQSWKLRYIEVVEQINEAHIKLAKFTKRKDYYRRNYDGSFKLIKI